MVTTQNDRFKSRVKETNRKAQGHLLSLQDKHGYWWGELHSNPTMEAEFLLLTHFLGIVDGHQQDKLVNHILESQREDGTWGQYYGAPGDLSTSIECYFAMKAIGVSPNAAGMMKAREFIVNSGGIANARVFTKIWLALFGQYRWEAIPTIPPELILLPHWVPMNPYDFASWARATMLPLSIVFAYRPVRTISPDMSLDELLPNATRMQEAFRGVPKNVFGWEKVFRAADALLRWYTSWPLKIGRAYSIRRVKEWILLHQEEDGSWGGIQPPWVYSLIALSVLGLKNNDPVMSKGIQGFKSFMVEDDGKLRVQACVSPGWDTCLAMIALLDSGLPANHESMIRASNWLITQQIHAVGDWGMKAKGVQPGGWAFEFHNNWYPDIDDGAEVLMALNRLGDQTQGRRSAAIKLGVDWMLEMQSRNGGWAAFDKDNTREAIAKIPFADFGEMLDPPSVDVTAHVLECLGRLGFSKDHPVIQHGLKYILREQHPDGPWFGRWGVNYIYGTAAVLPALEAIGYDMGSPNVQKAADWILSTQNEDGGWGETCASYADEALMGVGVSTPSQTAWAIIALCAVNLWNHPSTIRGLSHLIHSQQPDGNWTEPWYTGTGFPGYRIGKRPIETEPNKLNPGLPSGFMINYSMYRNYWPLMAIGRYNRHLDNPDLKSTSN